MPEESRIREDLSYLAQSASRCFTAAAEQESSLAAVGLRELGKQYLALATKIHDGSGTTEQVASPSKERASTELAAKAATSEPTEKSAG